MKSSVREIIESYDPNAPLSEAWTIPAPWYLDKDILECEQRTVFARSWQCVGRIEQVCAPGRYITWELAGEPLLLVRGSDGRLRGFFNVCRHHAAAVMTESEGHTQHLRCPYHGWTYSLEGELKGTPDFTDVCNFDRSDSGLVSVATDVWENWVFVKLERDEQSLDAFLGDELQKQVHSLRLSDFHWVERRRYTLDCNWKVFVDNYLDGGYHVPYLHKGLDSVLDYREYTIETGARFCLQSSPLVSSNAESQTSNVRQGERAFYYWIYPNFMINFYQGVLDTNLVLPLAVDRTEVIFDFYFTDVSDEAQERNLASIEVGHRIQVEDMDVCRSVQRGLASRSYKAGRLSVRREAGEHLFHRLLYADLRTALNQTACEDG